MATHKDLQSALEKYFGSRSDVPEKTVRQVREGREPTYLRRDQVSGQAPLSPLTPEEAEALYQYLGIPVEPQTGQGEGGKNDN